MEGKKKIRVKVYFNEKAFSEVIAEAEKANFRRRGLQIFTQKKNGLSGELVANTDGLSKFLKFCYRYYKEHEAERLENAAIIAKAEQELAEKKKKLGLA